MSNNNTSKTQLVVAQVVRRLRAQSLLKWLLLMAAVGVVLIAFLVTAYQLWLLPPQALQWAGGVLALSALIGLTLGLSHKPKALTAAQKLDQSHQLKDRLSTAIELLSRSSEQLNEFEQAQLRDAEQHSQELVISRAAPWRWPQEALLLVAAVALLFATQLIESTPPER
ncbi:MAG TPA: hypothetical protein EYN66_15050, partial [Myxococcales bacterium]|nr:hypothetical protein [Myxococcales bacterium]